MTSFYHEIFSPYKEGVVASMSGVITSLVALSVGTWTKTSSLSFYTSSLKSFLSWLTT